MHSKPVSELFPKHFDGQRFFNPNAAQARGLKDVPRFLLGSRREKSPGFVRDVRPSVPPSEVTGSDLRVTLVNHSTVLLQQRGSNILTDPIWSKRASPVSWAGPKRRRNPGVRLEDLPPVDTVLLSHNHYDHLDLSSLQRIAAGGKPTFIAPLGLARWFASKGIGPVYELDWGQSRQVEGAIIHSLPAFHFSARTPWDRNRTLWCGYMIESQNGLLYFAGDTGFGDHFAQIRDRFGAPRLALLPIGAYEPRWFMGPIHMAPDEAIRAHEILGAQTSIAVHHGTFQLAGEALDTPKRELAANGAPDSFRVLANGEAYAAAW